jgi:pimeloyl-ACP methyl ester carboxylesterase
MTTSEAADIFVPHAFEEQQVDLGEIRMNYATTGSPERPALLLIPSQTESWWGYEDAMPLLAEHFQVFAVDLRGQGRSTRTPGRYTLDNMGDDLVRFIDLVIGRPVIAAGNSSGGVLAAWLSAYAKPGQVRRVLCEDPPLFASEVDPACGHSIRQAAGPVFATFNKWLGDGWSVGDWTGMQAAFPTELPGYMLRALGPMRLGSPPDPARPDEPPQNMKEYDPEWGRAFWTGTVAASCDHARMLAAARTPMLLTHHYRDIDAETGSLMGAISEEQVRGVRRLVTGAGQEFALLDVPDAAHAMHRHDPELYARTLVDWGARNFTRDAP